GSAPSRPDFLGRFCPQLTTAPANGYTPGAEPDKQESDQLGPARIVPNFRSSTAHMALTQRLEIRQSHALVMTPQLMQAIKLLQLSNLDLAAYVEGELERNPLLERAGEGETAAERRAAEGDAAPAHEPADWAERDHGAVESAPREQPATELDDVPPADADAATSRSNGEGPTNYSEWAGAGAGGRDGNDYNLEAFVPAETTLADHLAEQL